MRRLKLKTVEPSQLGDELCGFIKTEPYNRFKARVSKSIHTVLYYPKYMKSKSL